VGNVKIHNSTDISSHSQSTQYIGQFDKSTTLQTALKLSETEVGNFTRISYSKCLRLSVRAFHGPPQPGWLAKELVAKILKISYFETPRGQS